MLLLVGVGGMEGVVAVAGVIPPFVIIDDDDDGGGGGGGLGDGTIVE